jgi:hypothetical protein
MKSMIKKAVYAGLGLVSDGTNAVRNLGRELARKANLSEAEGEKVARKLLAKSSNAVKSIRKTLDADVTKVADSIHGLICEGEECECDAPKTKKLKTAIPEKTPSKKRIKTPSVSARMSRSR